jgi:hypothetical protein
MKGASASFFNLGAASNGRSADWTMLRNRWEYLHVARAVLAMVGLILIVTAVTL